MIQSEPSANLETQQGTFREITVLDSSGKKSIKISGDGPLIEIFNGRGDPVVHLDTGTLFISHGSTKVAILGKTDAGGYLRLQGSDGVQALELRPDQKGSGKAKFFENGKVRLEVP